jgi:hypothetical protein
MTTSVAPFGIADSSDSDRQDVALIVAVPTHEISVSTITGRIFMVG